MPPGKPQRGSGWRALEAQTAELTVRLDAERETWPRLPVTRKTVAEVVAVTSWWARFEELEAREAAARQQVEALQAQIAELTVRLEAERERRTRYR